MKKVIVERTLTKPITAAGLMEARAVALECFEFYRVRHVRSLISLDGLRVICEYEAVDAESVRLATRKIDLPVDRVWSAEEFVSQVASP
jgi:hypothetical protein